MLEDTSIKIRHDLLLLRYTTYKNFVRFVKTFLEPHMSQPFIEEPYYETLWNSIWNNRHCLMQLPRGHSKTEMVGIWMTIYLAVLQPDNPFHPSKKQIIEQMLVAGDNDAKHAWVERIKHFFYDNSFLQSLIPLGADSKNQNIYWNDRVMYLRNGSIIHLKAITEKGIRGKHVDRLHADDMVTEQSNIVDSRVKDTWDGAVDGTTTNKLAMVQVTGTPLRMSDILFHLKDRNYSFIKLPAIIDYDSKIILSPKRWTFENLMETKRRIGSVRFECEYMLNPIDDSSSLIKSEWVRKCFSDMCSYTKHRPSHFHAIYMGVDFAFSDRITADNSAFVIIGEIREKDELTKQTRKKYQLIDVILKKGLSVLEQFDYIKSLHQTFKFSMIGLEDNSIKAVSKHISGYNLPFKLFHTSAKDPKDEKGIYKRYETMGKRNLILRLGNMFEQGNMIIPYLNDEDRIISERLLSECISFAQEDEKLVEIGIHPDSPIALAYALEAAGRPAMVVASVDTSISAAAMVSGKRIGNSFIGSM